MATYSHPISIRWGGGTAPTTVRVIDSTGAAQTPTLVTGIAETPAASGYYTAVATFDAAWGNARDLWSNGDGNYFPGDGPPCVNTMTVNGKIAIPDTTIASNVAGIKKVVQAQDD